VNQGISKLANLFLTLILTLTLTLSHQQVFYANVQGKCPDSRTIISVISYALLGRSNIIETVPINMGYNDKSRGALVYSRILSLVERITIDMIYRCFGCLVYAIVGRCVRALAVSIFARRCHISDNLEVAVESGVGGT